MKHTLTCRLGALLFFVLLATLLAPAVLASQGPPGEDAAALIDKHVGWLGGWAALDAVRSITFAGSFQFAGLSGPVSMLARRDGRQRTEVDLGVFRSVETLAGDDAWEPAGRSRRCAREASAARRQ